MPPHVFGHWGLDCQATNHGLSLCANRIDSQTLISTVVILLDEIFLILKQSNIDPRRQKAWKQIVLLPKGHCFKPPCFQALFNWSRNVSNNSSLCFSRVFLRAGVQVHALRCRPRFPVNVSTRLISRVGVHIRPTESPCNLRVFRNLRVKTVEVPPSCFFFSRWRDMPHHLR